MAGPTIGVVLGKNVSATTAPVTFIGTRACLVINATAYPTTLTLQVMGPSGAYVPINTANIIADGVYPFDCPAGQYRIFMAGGAPAGVFANLVSIPY